jgi:hypothetical protein
MELFERGDWVDWVFNPRDPRGPYAYLLSRPSEIEPIEDYTTRYLAGPYRVGRVFPFAGLPEGHVPPHPQVVGIWMYPNPCFNPKGQLVKLRHFSGYLFKRVDPPADTK